MEGGGKKEVVEKRVRRVRALRKKIKSLERAIRKSPKPALKRSRRAHSIVIKRSKAESPRVRFTGYANNPTEGCTIKLTDYYHASVRSQPPYSASACCGQRRLGNDGRRWTAVENGNKCKWVHS